MSLIGVQPISEELKKYSYSKEASWVIICGNTIVGFASYINKEVKLFRPKLKLSKSVIAFAIEEYLSRPVVDTPTAKNVMVAPKGDVIQVESRA